MTNIITKEESKKLIHSTNGKIFSSTFIKKDGTHRLLIGRLKVTKGLKENAKPRPYDPSKYNLVCVYDMKAEGYRMINTNTLTKLSINAKKYIIKNV
jgi:hypothetical protein